MLATPPSRLTPGRIGLLAWLTAAVIMLVVQWTAITALDTVDPDDALRLVQVRDLIAGQSWWDIMQHRINPAEGGGLMHWSRIVDLPLAAGIIALRPIMGQTLAEQVVMAIWPLILLGLLLALAARCFAQISEHRVAAIATALIATDYLILFQFAPLRIDHHGWQILLSLAMVHRLIGPPDARSGAWAGLFAALLIAISLEGLPAIVLVAAIMAVEWMWTGARAARLRLMLFLSTLAALAAAVQLATRGPDALRQTWCDALSLPYLAAFATAALAISLLAPMADRLAPTRRWVRGAALVVAGALSATGLIVVEPTCGSGPFGTLDPLVVQYWYVNVHEGLPVWTNLGPIFAFALMPMLVGLAGTIFALRQAPDAQARRIWLIMLAMVAGTMVVALLVLRAASLAHLLAMPGCAWLLVAAWHRARAVQTAGPRIIATLAAAALIPPFAGAALAIFLIEPGKTVPANAQAALAARSVACVDQASSSALNALAPATIMAPLDIGPHLLQRTHHSVTATGHHRNNAVMAETIAAYVGAPERAHERALALGASLIVICPGATEIANFQQAEGDTLADLLMTGRAPDWLESVAMPAGARLRVWRIRPERQTSSAGPA